METFTVHQGKDKALLYLICGIQELAFCVCLVSQNLPCLQVLSVEIQAVIPGAILNSEQAMESYFVIVDEKEKVITIGCERHLKKSSQVKEQIKGTTLCCDG